MQETWKEIGESDGVYLVSDKGRIRRYDKEKCLKPTINKRGYHRVKLYVYNQKYVRRVHRLVALAFVPNPEGLPEVNHLDGDKDNNRADNLEWSTRVDNLRHARDNMGNAPGNNRQVITREKATEIKRDLLTWPGTVRGLALQHGVSFYIVKNIKQGSAWADVEVD